MDAIRSTNHINPSTLHITDARPFAAAVGNKMAGAGEDLCLIDRSIYLFIRVFLSHTSFRSLPSPLSGYEVYPNTKIEFMDIHNIHAMRASLDRLHAVCMSGAVTASRVEDRYACVSAGGIVCMCAYV